MTKKDAGLRPASSRLRARSKLTTKVVMATKIGLSYYTVDTDRYLDIRIKRLRKDYGCRGLAVYDYVLCEIYRDKGCFIEWDESTAFDVAEYLGLKESVVQEIVKYCAAVGLFNEELLRRGIITSASIQKRYLEMATRAKRKVVVIPQVCKIPEVEAHLPEDGAQIREKSGRWPQSKEKESKDNLSSATSPSRANEEPKATGDEFLRIDEVAAYLKSQREWMEALCINGHFEMDYIRARIDDFAVELRLQGQTRKEKNDSKRHFFNWLRKNKHHHESTPGPRATAGDITCDEVVHGCKQRVAQRMARAKTREMGPHGS